LLSISKGAHSHKFIANKAVLPEHHSLGAELNSLRLVSSFQDIRRFPPLVVHRGDMTAIALQYIAFEDYEGDVTKIEGCAQICSAIQLNKAISLLLEIRNDMKEMKSDGKAVRKTTEETLEEISRKRDERSHVKRPSAA
jgi:hypothetical protein